MMTFLPYPDFAASARVLDPVRLGNQRREALACIKSITRESGWRHHPVSKMWRLYPDALRAYYNAICTEWIERGKTHHLPRDLRVPATIRMPWWLGDERLHSSHRAALLFKNADWYRGFGWEEEPRIDYWYPVRSKLGPVLPTNLGGPEFEFALEE